MSSQGADFFCQKVTAQDLKVDENITINSDGKKTVTFFSKDSTVTFQVASASGSVTAFRIVGLPTALAGTPGDEVYSLSVSAAADLVGKKVLCIA